MSSRIEYHGKSGQHLKYSVCKPDGTPKGAPLHLLPESQTPGYYTTISHTNLEKDDKVVIYGPENVLYEGEPLTYEGDYVIVDETVGKGEFSAEAQDLAGTKQTEAKQKDERNILMIDVKSSKENWEAIKKEYGLSKKDFGKKINFVKDPFKRKIIFRDVEHAFVLASQDFSKPAIILAGGVIEELLRLYLEHKNVKMTSDRFVDYINACEKLLKRGVWRLTDSVRDFRNLVHLANEKEKKHTISKATAKGAVSSIFTIANDF